MEHEQHVGHPPTPDIAGRQVFETLALDTEEDEPEEDQPSSVSVAEFCKAVLFPPETKLEEALWFFWKH